MANAWTLLVQRGVGLFERDKPVASPLSVANARPKSPLTQPHSIWIDVIFRYFFVCWMGKGSTEKQFAFREHMLFLKLLFACAQIFTKVCGW